MQSPLRRRAAGGGVTAFASVVSALVLAGCAATSTNEAACRTFGEAFADLPETDAIGLRLSSLSVGLERAEAQANGEIAETIDAAGLMLTALISEASRTGSVDRESSVARSFAGLSIAVQNACEAQGFRVELRDIG